MNSKLNKFNSFDYFNETSLFSYVDEEFES